MFSCFHFAIESLCDELVSKTYPQYRHIHVLYVLLAISGTLYIRSPAQYDAMGLVCHYLIYGQSVFHKLHIHIKVSHSPVYEMAELAVVVHLSLIHISEPTRLGMISYAVFCLKKKKNKNTHHY